MPSIGKKHIELAYKWIPSAITYGSGASLTLLYFTDWKLILQYVPYYGKKFQE
ncbi:cytochrome b-c1 complex subunit 10 [Copidosoma floridanum]|uniref:cytochrome b-c1 complex subunit 10 n=1 Tax=Copidosoma floridanum TaxID=29053 RepID=UPI0006C93F47|nr:cytochrome b-c1 complex subunit 10 [Copidosoma floridanum]